MLGVLGFFVVEPYYYYYYYYDDDDGDHHCYHYRYRLSLTLPLVLKTTPSILKSEWRLPEPAMGPFQAAAGIFRSLPVLGIGFRQLNSFRFPWTNVKVGRVEAGGSRFCKACCATNPR